MVTFLGWSRGRVPGSILRTGTSPARERSLILPLLTTKEATPLYRSLRGHESTPPPSGREISPDSGNQDVPLHGPCRALPQRVLGGIQVSITIQKQWEHVPVLQGNGAGETTGACNLPTLCLRVTGAAVVPLKPLRFEIQALQLLVERVSYSTMCTTYLSSSLNIVKAIFLDQKLYW